MVRRSRLGARFGLATLLIAASLTAQTPSGTPPSSVSEAGPPPPDLCFKNAAGLGICIPGATGSCDSYSECDASTPCGDGFVCVYDSCCETTLDGICQPPASEDAGCTNPGTCGSYSTCQASLLHEDFSADVIYNGGVHCGTTDPFIRENSCPASAFASSPLDHLRWGTSGTCASYASAAGQYYSFWGLDTSHCDGVVMEFDYAVDFQEDFDFDRVYLAVQTHPSNTGRYVVVATNPSAGGTIRQMCTGSPLPVGNLIADGAWHHHRIALGKEEFVELLLVAETSDGVLNSGQGFLLDDLRIDCGDLVFQNGFEGSNLMSWSATTQPRPQFQVDQPGTCGSFEPCDGPELFSDLRCLSMETTEGIALCVDDHNCNTSCVSSTDCPADEVCVVNTCCGGPVCVPATCSTSFNLATP